MPTPLAPPEAHWFGLERHEGQRWIRVENPAWGPSSKWWEAQTNDPGELAARFGAGVYRVVWTKKDRRSKLGESEPFRVGEATPAPEPAESGATLGAEQLGALELEPEGQAVAVPVRLDAAPMPAPTLGSSAELATLDGPTRQVVVLFDLLDRQHQRSKQADWAQWQRMQQSEAQRHREALQAADHRHQLQVAEVRAFYEQMGKARAIQAAEGAQQQTHALATIETRVATMQQQLDEEAEPLDAEVVAQQMSQNPNDLERLVVGVQKLAQIVLQSPVGEALAQRMQESTGIPLAPTEEAGGE